MHLIERPSLCERLGRTTPGRLVLCLGIVGLVALCSFLVIGLVDSHLAAADVYAGYSQSGLGHVDSPTIDWPTAQGMLFKLDYVSHDTYLDITLSMGDTYKIECKNGDESSYFIVTTSPGPADAFEPLLYLVPEYIAAMGYDAVAVSPIEGDGHYAVSDLNLVSNPDISVYVDHTIVDFEIKVLDFALEEADYDLIKAKRMEAITCGILLADDADYVPATVIVDGQVYDTEIRLKGDWTDHLEGDKWSLRIKVEDDCILGMEKLSIQPPESRVGVGEYLIHEFYREQGGVAPRYTFVDVVVNGVYRGVYALEEAFDKRMVESSSKREGAILRFNEDTLWTGRVYYDSEWLSRFAADVEPFNKSKTLADPLLYDYVTYGTYLLNAARDGTIAARESFDLDMTARYYATLDVFGAHHGCIWHNMRFYYNPVTARLEPITFDDLYWSYRDLSSVTIMSPVQEHLFADSAFLDVYYRVLHELADEAEGFLEDQSTAISMYDYVLGRDGYGPFNPVVVYEQVAMVDSIESDQGITCLVEAGNLGADTITVSISSNNVLPVTIVDVTYNEASISFESPPISEEGELLLLDAAQVSEIDGLCISYTLPNLTTVFRQDVLDVR